MIAGFGVNCRFGCWAASYGGEWGAGEGVGAGKACDAAPSGEPGAAGADEFCADDVRAVVLQRGDFWGVGDVAAERGDGAGALLRRGGAAAGGHVGVHDGQHVRRHGVRVLRRLLAVVRRHPGALVRRGRGLPRARAGPPPRRRHLPPRLDHLHLPHVARHLAHQPRPQRPLRLPHPHLPPPHHRRIQRQCHPRPPRQTGWWLLRRFHGRNCVVPGACWNFDT